MIDTFFDILEKIFFTDIIGQLNLYTVLSTVFKYIFVIIVLYFIYSIVRLIYFDVKQMNEKKDNVDASIKLIGNKDDYSFNVENEYYIGAKLTIGRNPRNMVSINDKFLSQDHCMIEYYSGEYFIVDQNSGNGVYVNKEKIDNLRILHDRDVIGIGQLEFMFIRGDRND